MNTVHARPHGAATLFGGSDDARDARAWLDEPEIPRLGLRFLVSAVLTAQLVAIAILGRGERVAWLELALATPVVGWAALPFFERALAALRRRRANMFALVSLGTITAYVYSIASIDLGGPLYFGAAASTITLVLLGELVERYARRRAIAEIGDVNSVERALAPATRIEDVADRISAALVPAAILVAAFAAAGWIAFGPAPKLANAVTSAVSVLVIACPAAIGLATPLSFFFAAAAARRAGIRLRDATTTETLAKVTTLVVDRTGVLTEGAPKVSAVEPADGIDRAELLRLAAAAERECEHPVARAVVAHAGIDDGAPRSIRRPVPGRGVVAEVDGHEIVLGSYALVSAHAVRVPAEALARAEVLRRDGASVSFAAVDGRYAGLVAFGDAARDSARAAIAELRRLGVRVAMMTGSSRTLGRSMARELDLHDGEIFAHVHPDDRVGLVEELRARGETVAVAALPNRHVAASSAAHVALSLGASDHADVTVPDGDLEGVVRAIRLARRTVRNVRQSLVVAIGYNVLAIPLAAVLGLSPLVAAGVMGLGTISVIASALRLLRAQ